MKLFCIGLLIGPLLIHVNSFNSQRFRFLKPSRSSLLHMTLIPISANDFSEISPRTVTTAQWVSYWGTNKLERIQKVMESILVSYGGLWLSWFLSFMAGSFFSSLIGTLLVFNWMFGPWWQSSRNNRNAWYQNGKPLFHAVYFGRIVSLNKITQKSQRAIGTSTQKFLDLIVKDENDRELEIVTPWEEQYINLRLEMSIQTIVASPKSDFSTIATLTDSYIPACDVWVGDYPYLNKSRFKKFIEGLKSFKAEIKPDSKYEDDSIDESDDENDLLMKEVQLEDDGSEASGPLNAGMTDHKFIDVPIIDWNYDWSQGSQRQSPKQFKSDLRRKR